jgi:hypothetical protein
MFARMIFLRPTVLFVMAGFSLPSCAQQTPLDGSKVLSPQNQVATLPTNADIIGPDGVVYPDFSRAGVPGGIPNVPVKARAEQFGAVANDDQDDSAAVQKAVDSLGESGGAITLGAGTFVFDNTVRVSKTELLFAQQEKARRPSCLASWNKNWTIPTRALRACRLFRLRVSRIPSE